MNPSRLLYTIGWYLATPLIVVYLLWRSRRQPEYRSHWPERWGFVAKRRSAAPLIWIHAVSVGETRAAQPLIDALAESYPQCEWLLTCMTPTGRETGRAVFGERVRQAYLPYDYPWAARRFLAGWRPVLGIIMETELWPNLVAQARHAGLPLALVNARLSERSLSKGLRWSMLIGPALASLDVVAAQTESDAARLLKLGRSAASVTGNLKFDVSPPAEQLALGRRWKAALGGRPVVLAASTRDGEERLLFQAWIAAREAGRLRNGANNETALLVVVPRHPQRFDDVSAQARAEGLRLARRSELDFAAGPAPASAAGADPSRQSIDVLLGDSMGEMFAYYALSDLAIIGGSLLAFGGQNLIEACAAAVPVLVGPHTFNFAEAAEQAVAAGAALRVESAARAVASAIDLLEHPAALQTMSLAADRFARTHRGATRRTLEALAPLLRVI
jgi:3-deoxy-D-manno-octulosonic-acid transferase